MDKGLLRLDLREERSGRAKHERLRDHFVNEMIAGRLKPGETVPSENHLIKTLGVARMTIRQAMNSLEDEGLIRRVQGKGTFVEDNARRKLKRGQDIFALVVPETRTAFYPSLLHGFEAAAGDIHYQAIICNTDDEVARQAEIVLQLMDKEIGGVAMVPTARTATPAVHVRQLQKHGIPVVFCHRRVEETTAPLLAIPFHQVGRLAGQVLVERGHRRIAAINRGPARSTTEAENGLGEVLRDAGCELIVEHFTTPTVAIRREDIWETLRTLFSRPQPPTAIFANDGAAEMIYLLLPELGLRVPDDVSMIGFGSAWREGALLQRLASVVIDEIATGRQAISLLEEMRRGERPIDDNEEFILPVSLYEGETLAVAPGQPCMSFTKTDAFTRN